ncbi:MAG: hypothetical protein PHG84_04125 [Endomicrobiaceae bacterium]|jgi:hypothetical protein|nr:hypothetical protein [Endomicrobiaceae bacterium]MDD3053571.1 hypothetical protein [Endomicrobiaceae bacterium]MDD3922388.1 hypothetical protein [Endomicrobiaceae bacterium]MDD5102336.1 hypothetical protein [Endomicrobiaceae bacterium]
MKSITINLSKILKILVLTALMASFSFIIQYYLNLKSDNIKILEDLKIAIFVDSNTEESVVLSEINKFFYFNIVEYIDANKSYNKAVELNPELVNITPENTISYPCYVLVNNVSAVNMQQLEEIKTEISSIVFVKDVVYDVKAFELFFNNINLLLNYEKIFYYISFFIVIVFFSKLILFILKKKFREIIYEILYGCFSALFGYVIICICAAMIHNSIFILDWHILFILIPFGAIISFMMKESNAKL